MELHGRSALVTGGASGLGRATALRLAAAGAHVCVADAGDPQRPEELADAGIVVQRADVVDADEVAAALDRAEERGPLAVAVSCAGIVGAGRVLGRNGPLPLGQFQKVVSVNLIGTFNVVRLAAERMAAASSGEEEQPEERGVIVNTASVAAFDGQIGQAAYAASKGGVVGMTLPLARDLSGRRVRVMTIAPGIFATPMMAGLSEQAQASLGEQVPHPARLGRPEEYAQLVAHIIANPMLNGEVIRLDGALRMGPR
ncbi:MAG: SDR family NAD(P)-dependent oxidoreductase [Egibacteraceae bacterium]